MNQSTDPVFRVHPRLEELRKVNEETGLPLTILIDRALMFYLENEYNFNGLKELINGVLGLYDGLCMDIPEEREILAEAITRTILKGKKHGKEADQEAKR